MSTTNEVEPGCCCCFFERANSEEKEPLSTQKKPGKHDVSTLQIAPPSPEQGPQPVLMASSSKETFHDVHLSDGDPTTPAHPPAESRVPGTPSTPNVLDISFQDTNY